MSFQEWHTPRNCIADWIISLASVAGGLYLVRRIFIISGDRMVALWL